MAQFPAGQTGPNFSATGTGARADNFNVDTIIENLLSVRGKRPGKQVALTETELRNLC